MIDTKVLSRKFSDPKVRLACILCLLLGAGAALYFLLIRPRPAAPPVVDTSAKGGKYVDLAPGQRRLVDDWVDRFNKVMGKPIEPGKLYDDLALSTKTTFFAVTHALLKTPLTDSSGRPMAMTALDLVSRVETVAGKVPNAGGDKQFRMYVALRPGAQQTLERCREFKRQVDNTIYHKGYPTCFRGVGGTPSIQFSLARDGKRGDIDVDYRSSIFPIMLINGHLTASNSDVRAGDNDQRHNVHWAGLSNWWRGFLGLPLYEAPRTEVAALGNPVSKEPRLKKRVKPEEAIHDFLHAWLVERNPGVAVGYISPRAFACMEIEKGAPVDRGVARFQMFRAMQAVNEKLGKPETIAQVIRGVTLTGPRGKVLEQPYHSEFVMYDVRQDLAEQFDCENRLYPERVDRKRSTSTEFGDYIGAVFQVRTDGINGEAVATVWAKEKGAWMLVSYDVEPEFKPGAFPASQPPQPAPSEPPLPVIGGDPEMKLAARRFLEAWYLRRDSESAFRYLSPRCFPCYNIYRPEDAPLAKSADEAGKLIRERMSLLSGWAGTSERLEDMLIAMEPHHPDLKIVEHDQAKAFSIVSVPDHMGAAADCGKLKPGETPHFERSGPMTHGTFYAVSTRLKKAGPDAAVLWTVWAKHATQWRIVSYLVMTP